MAVTVKGTPTSAAAASVTLPAHAVGDLIVIFAFRDGSTTVPTKPTAGSTVPSWVDIDANTGGATCSSRTAYFVATATNHTSGTWTGATGMVAVVLQGQGARPIGGHTESGGSSSTSATAPALISPVVNALPSTQWTTDGTAAVLEFFGHRNVTAWGTAPTGYTRQTSVATEVCCNTKNDTTAVPAATAQTATISANGGYRGATIEILPVAQKAEMLKDEFVTKDTTKFDWSPNASVINGSAELDAVTVGVAEYLQTKALYDLTGSSFSFKVTGINISGTTAYAALYLMDVITDPSTGTFEEMWAAQDNTLKLDEVIGNVADAGAVSLPYSLTNFAWWRVRESGGTIFWDTSTNGVTWVNRRSKTVGALNLSQVLISVYVLSTDATTTVFAIDHLNPPLGALAAALKKATASLAGVAGAETGTIAATTKKVTANFSGTQRYIGTMAPTIRKVTASISGVEYPQGSIAASVKKLTASLSATQRYIGSVAVTLKPVTASFSGYMRPAGSITATLKKATFSASGLEKYIGTIAVTQKKLTASFTGQQYYSGAIATTIKKLTSSFVGYEQPVGSIVSTVKKVQFSSVGAVAAVVGSISASLKHPTASLSGKEFPRGSIAVTAKKPTASLSGVQKYVGAIASSVQKTTFAGSGYRRPTGPIAVTIKKLTYAASGIAYPGGPLAVSLKKAQFSGGGAQRYLGVINVTTKKTLFAGSGSKTLAVGGTLGSSIKKIVSASSGAVFGPYRSGALLASRGFRLMKTASGRLIKLGG